jgi:hypothetical protein
MPKQVRIRRGTTAQHATFVGADGEVTFDTTKKVLVVHDGVTAGGKPVDGFVKLDPGAPMSRQEVKTCFSVSGGDSDTDSFTVQYPARFASQVIVDDTFAARRIQLQQETLPYAASVALDFATFGLKLINLTGNLSLTGVNMQNGRQLLVRLKSDASTRTLAFPGWHFIGAAAPASLAAGKVAMLWLWCFGGADTDVVAKYLAEP